MKPRVGQLAQSGATAGQILLWNGTEWVPSSTFNPGNLAQDGAATGQALIWNGVAWAPGYPQSIFTAKVYLNSVQNVPNGVFTAVSYDTVAWDPQGMVDLVAHPTRITAVHAGKYRLTAGVRFDPNPTGARQMAIRVNNATTWATFSVPAVTEALQISALTGTVDVALAIGDFVEMQVRQSSGGALSVGAAGDPRTYLSVVMS